MSYPTQVLREQLKQNKYNLTGEEKWETKDKRLLTVEEMDPSHAKNALKMVIRRLHLGAISTGARNISHLQGLEDDEEIRNLLKFYLQNREAFCLVVYAECFWMDLPPVEREKVFAECLTPKN